jgi:hypothetical protein
VGPDARATRIVPSTSGAAGRQGHAPVTRTAPFRARPRASSSGG